MRRADDWREAKRSGAWDDWRWQLRHALRGVDSLAFLLAPGPDSAAKQALAQVAERYPVALTPYLVDLIEASVQDPERCPEGRALGRQFLPDNAELAPDYAIDPLEEEANAPVPGLLQRYPDRAVILLSNACASYCRFCTRKHRVGGRAPTWWGHADAIMSYLEDHRRIRDVLISGGDPLVLPSAALGKVLERVSSLPHVDVVRVATRTPAQLPMRFDDPGLLPVLARSGKVWVNTQFNHPLELSVRARKACAALVDAGIPVGNQSVLLRGVNDEVEVLETLFRGLVAARVRPYYLFLCEPGRGLGHFRTTVAEGLGLVGALRGRVSGLAQPSLAVDLPGGQGKVRLEPEAILGREGDDVLLRSWRGQVVRYPDPPATPKPLAPDVSDAGDPGN